MKKPKIKLFSFVMTVLSFLYLIYVYCSEETAMSADAVGGDPGGKVLPYIMGAIVFIGSLYKTIKERSEYKQQDKETTMLFVSTLCLALAYIFLNKLIGFVILTVILLYITIYLYTTIGEERGLRQSSIGGVSTMVVTIFVYYIFRLVSKKLLKLGRSGVMPIFKTSSSTACVALLIVSVFLFVFIFFLGKKIKKQGFSKVWNASIVTFATTLYLYIVFKQFFGVTLAPGLLKF